VQEALINNFIRPKTAVFLIRFYKINTENNLAEREKRGASKLIPRQKGNLDSGST